MKIDANLKKELLEYFEGEHGPLIQLWENTEIGDFDDIQWDYAQTLEAVQDLSIPADQLGQLGDDIAVQIYRRLMAAEVIQ